MLRVIRKLTHLPTAKKATREPQADKNAPKDTVEELDQVVGNAEDDIGDRITNIREHELLFDENSLLTSFGPMLVHICGSPHKFKVCGVVGAESTV